MPGESWARAVVNAAFWPQAEATAYLQWLVARGSVPPRLISQFLHCATYRATFHSRVGAAISLLTMRARRRALAGNARERAAILDDLHRVLVAEALLRPLDDGLALFAEFDIAPATSTREGMVQSPAMAAALGAFGFAAAADGTAASPRQALARTLEAARRSPILQGRKAGVFALPFAPAQGPLAGYLAVKALWAAVRGRAPQFEDMDRFLAFLHGYVHEDAEFARRLLTPDVNPPRLVGSAAGRLSERLLALATAGPALLQGQVAAWEEACATGAPVASALGIDATASAEADDAMALLLQEPDQKLPMGQFAMHAFMTLQGRAFYVLGHVPAQARVSGDRTEFVARGDADVRFDVAFAPHTRPAWLRGSAVSGELVAAMPVGVPAMLVYFVTREDCVPVYAQGTLEGVDLSAFQRHVAHARHNETIHGYLADALAEVLRGPRLTQWRASFEGTLRLAADALYARLATVGLAPAAADTVLVHLREGGLLALLDNDLDLVKAITAIGLANTATTRDASIARFAADAGVSEALLVRAQAQAKQRHGMRLLEVSEPGETRALV